MTTERDTLVPPGKTEDSCGQVEKPDVRGHGQGHGRGRGHGHGHGHGHRPEELLLTDH